MDPPKEDRTGEAVWKLEELLRHYSKRVLNGSSFHEDSKPLEQELCTTVTVTKLRHISC